MHITSSCAIALYCIMHTPRATVKKLESYRSTYVWSHKERFDFFVAHPVVVPSSIPPVHSGDFQLEPRTAVRCVFMFFARFVSGIGALRHSRLKRTDAVTTPNPSTGHATNNSADLLTSNRACRSNGNSYSSMSFQPAAGTVRPIDMHNQPSRSQPKMCSVRVRVEFAFNVLRETITITVALFGANFAPVNTTYLHYHRLLRSLL